MNGNPLSEQGQLSGAAIYTYTLDQGADPRDIIGCYSQTSGDPLGISLYSLSAYPQHWFQMQYSATDNVSTGDHRIYCKWEDPSTDLIWDFPLVDVNDGYSVGVFDATPVINSTNRPVVYAGDQGGTLLQINGLNFGSAGNILLCPSGSNCNPSSFPSGSLCGAPTNPDPNLCYKIVSNGWSDENISVLLYATASVAASYDLVVVSKGVNGLANGFLQMGSQTTTGVSPLAQAVVQPRQPLMKLELANPATPTVISTDGKYSEDTTIRVTAVRADGSTINTFTGPVAVAEDTSNPVYVPIYSQNGGTLCDSCVFNQVSILLGGTATFLARSLASPIDPNGGGVISAPPDPALVKTSNYLVYGGNPLVVPQWVISEYEDGKVAGTLYDWAVARVLDLLASATGDVATVLQSVSDYRIDYIQNAEGVVFRAHAVQSEVTLNPYFTEMRLDSAGGPVCGHARTKSFTHLVYHESRHAYKNTIATTPGNDKDGDFLVNNVPIAPYAILLDTTAVRTTCNALAVDPQGLQGIPTLLSYHGDLIADQPDAPDFASYASEEDAYSFATTWTPAH